MPPKSFSKSGMSLPLFPKCVPIIWQYITVPPPPSTVRDGDDQLHGSGSSTRTQSEDTRRRRRLDRLAGLLRPSPPPRHRYGCQSTHSDEMEVLDEPCLMSTLYLYGLVCRVAASFSHCVVGEGATCLSEINRTSSISRFPASFRVSILTLSLSPQSSSLPAIPSPLPSL